MPVPVNTRLLIAWHTWILIVGSGIRILTCICTFYVAAAIVVAVAALFRGMCMLSLSQCVCVCGSPYSNAHISIFTNKLIHKQACSVESQAQQYSNATAAKHRMVFIGIVHTVHVFKFAHVPN